MVPFFIIHYASHNTFRKIFDIPHDMLYCNNHIRGKNICRNLDIKHNPLHMLNTMCRHTLLLHRSLRTHMSNPHPGEFLYIHSMLYIMFRICCTRASKSYIRHIPCIKHLLLCHNLLMHLFRNNLGSKFRSHLLKLHSKDEEANMHQFLRQHSCLQFPKPNHQLQFRMFQKSNRNLCR